MEMNQSALSGLYGDLPNQPTRFEAFRLAQTRVFLHEFVEIGNGNKLLDVWCL